MTLRRFIIQVADLIEFNDMVFIFPSPKYRIFPVISVVRFIQARLLPLLFLTSQASSSAADLVNTTSTGAINVTAVSEFETLRVNWMNTLIADLLSTKSSTSINGRASGYQTTMVYTLSSIKVASLSLIHI
jgi:hypothetical protein